MMVTLGIAKKLGTSKENLDKIVKVIYDRCYCEWRFARAAATLCSNLEGLQVEDVKFRSVVLRYVQTDYKRKDELRKESTSKFLGHAAFLCQMFGVVRVNDNEPMIPLLNPVLDVLCICLEKGSPEEATLCGASQLFVVGKLLQDVGERLKVNTLKNLVRDKVLDNVGSRETRLLLIDAVEGFASNWRLHLAKKVYN